MKNYTHDLAGNVTNDGVNTYAYDARGRLTTATVAGVNSVRHYNALGERTFRSPQPGINTAYAYDQAGRLIGEYTSNTLNGTTYGIEYVYLEGMVVGLAPFTVPVVGQPAQYQGLFYVHPDHLDTPRLVTNTANQARWRWDLAEPFGSNPANENPAGLGTFPFSHRFPGQVIDPETNTHYNMARDYDPPTGRYIQSDPIGLLAGINTYAYVESNPLSRIDPEGLWVIQAIGGVIGGAAGAIQAANAGGGWTSQNASAIAWGAVVGAGAGVAAAFVPTSWGVFGTALAGGLIGGTGNAVNQYVTTGNVCWGQAGVQAGIGAISGGLGNAVGLGRALQYIGQNRTYSGFTSPTVISANLRNAVNAGAATSVGASAASQMGANLFVPTTLGGYNSGSMSCGCQ